MADATLLFVHGFFIIQMMSFISIITIAVIITIIVIIITIIIPSIIVILYYGLLKFSKTFFKEYLHSKHD